MPSSSLGPRRKRTALPLLAFGASLVGAFLAGGNATALAQTNNASQDQASAKNQYQEDDVPAFGVVVDSSPSGAVLVLDTVQGCPAEKAGIEYGDYLTSINGKKIKSPEQFRELVQGMKPGEEISVTVWRQGDKMNKRVTLASKADKPPKSDKAWLGVMLAETDQDGAKIERVLPRSPAAEAGLQAGDLITKQGDRQVTDAQAFISRVADAEPNSKLELTVQRDGKQKQITVTLGHLDSAPMNFLRQAMRPAMPNQQDGGSWMDRQQPFEPLGAPSITDDALDELRQRVRDLERQVQEALNSDEDKQGEPRLEDSIEDLSQIATPSGSETFLVVQRGNRDQRDGRYRDGRDRDGRYRDSRYRDWRNRDWRNRDWDDRDWRNRYQRGYRSPLYRSPRYGNRYFYNNGRPYYYGGYNRGFGYGRPGIRFGNFGIYWY